MNDSTGEPTAVADDGDETTVVADAAGPTQAAGLAWSDCDDDYTIVASPPGTGTMAAAALDAEDLWTDDDDREYASTTVKMFVGLMAVVVIAAGWISYVFLTHHHDDDNAPAPMPASAAPTSTATQTPVAAPAPSSPDDTVVPSTAAPTSTVTVTQTPKPAPTVTEEAPPLPPITVQAPPPAAAPSADDEFI